MDKSFFVNILIAPAKNAIAQINRIIDPVIALFFA
jgi:hypothetical protein